MNKFQLAALWAAGIAASVYFFIKHTEVYLTAPAIIIAALIGVTIWFFRKPDEGVAGHIHGAAMTGFKPSNELTKSAFPSVEIPGMGKRVLTFKKDSLEYRGSEYYYRDITGVLYNTVSVAVHGIPSSQTYSYGIRSAAGKFTATFASAFFINNDKYKEKYAKIIEFSKAHLEPVLVARIVKDIFVSGRSVKIGAVEFTREGYSMKKIFGGADAVKWGGRVYIPQYAEGIVYLYKDKDGKARTFAALSMAKENAVLLPELVQACYNQVNTAR
jgi:hypothetical protein